MDNIVPVGKQKSRVANTDVANVTLAKHIIGVNSSTMYEELPFIGFWACRPQELLVRSAIYEINWVKVFKLFIMTKSQLFRFFLFFLSRDPYQPSLQMFPW